MLCLNSNGFSSKIDFCSFSADSGGDASPDMSLRQSRPSAMNSAEAAASADAAAADTDQSRNLQDRTVLEGAVRDLDRAALAGAARNLNRAVSAGADLA